MMGKGFFCIIGIIGAIILGAPMGAYAQSGPNVANSQHDNMMGYGLESISTTGSVIPAPSRNDARLRRVIYRVDQVVLVLATQGFQVTIELAPNELIENVAIGDSAGWQVTPNRRANALFVKPVEAAAHTNMYVSTNMRQYAFELQSMSAQSTPSQNGANPPATAPTLEPFFQLSFAYPAEDWAIETPVVAENITNYLAAGEAALLPLRAYDNGQDSFLTFAPGQELPAVFARAQNGEESLINFNMLGDVMVIARTAPIFVLRAGTEEATLTRQSSDMLNPPTNRLGHHDR